MSPKKTKSIQKRWEVQYAMDILSDVITKVKEDDKLGTYINALLSFGERIKSVDWFIVLKDLFSTLAQLIEEEDIIIFDILRIFYLSGARFRRKEIVQISKIRRNLLETAIYSGNWSIANFLVKFALETDVVLMKTPQFWNPQLAHKATPSQWGKAIQLVVKSCVNSETIRRGVSNVDFASQWTARLKNIKSVMDNGYVTLLDLIGYPSAFMLMVRLGAELTVPNAAPNTTLPYYIWSSGLTRIEKIHLLKFLESVNPTLFETPCGPNNVKLVYECLRSGCVSAIHSVKALQTKIDMNMKDATGRGIGYYITPKMIYRKMFTSDEFLGYALVARRGRTSVVNHLLRIYPRGIDKYFNRFPKLMKAIGILMKDDKKVLLPYLKMAHYDTCLMAYCIAQGHMPPRNNFVWDDLASARIDFEIVPKTLESSDPVSELKSCHICDLPDDIIGLIILDLRFSDMMRFFSVSKSMQEVFKRLTSPLLWRKIAMNNMNSFKMKYLESQPITDWRSHVIKEMRWRKNWKDQRFTEKMIFTELETNFCYVADDNWLVVTETVKSQRVLCWNCHTYQTVSMRLSHPLGNIHILYSTPTSLTIAICGDPWEKPVVIIADPTTNTVLKEIECCLPSRGNPFFFKYQSKLCFVARDLLEVDIEAGVTKVLKHLPGHRSVRRVSVDVNEDSAIIDDAYAQILDADRNFIKLPEPASHKHNHVYYIAKGSDEVNTIEHVLEFGRWYRHCAEDTMSSIIIDTENNRLVFKYRLGGITLLLHPNLKTWYTAWIEERHHYSIAMNSRYLFLYDEDANCIYCRDFD